MNDDLQASLNELIRSGSTSNPALNSLLSDYTKYHVVLVIVGGLFVLGFLLLSIFSWTQFKRAPKAGNRRWTFEKKTYFSFGLSSAVVGLLMALIVAANVSSVLSPRQGLSGSLGMLGTPRAGSRADELHQAFSTWLRSGTADMPSLIQSRIDDRLAWQRPKAAICSVVFIVFTVLSARIWRTLIRKSRVREGRWTLKDVALLAVGAGTGSACLLLMVMVIGNAQGSFAPMSLTLFYG